MVIASFFLFCSRRRARRAGVEASGQKGRRLGGRNFCPPAKFFLKGFENCFALMFGLMPNGGNASLRLGRGVNFYPAPSFALVLGPPPNPLLPPRPRSDCPFFQRNWRPCQFHWHAASKFSIFSVSYTNNRIVSSISTLPLPFGNLY